MLLPIHHVDDDDDDWFACATAGVSTMHLSCDVEARGGRGGVCLRLGERVTFFRTASPLMVVILLAVCSCSCKVIDAFVCFSVCTCN